MSRKELGKLLLMALGGMLLISVAAFFVLQATGGVGSLLRLFFPPTPAINVNVLLPEQVSVHSDFDLEVRVENAGSEILRIDQVLLPRAWLEQVTVRAISPAVEGQWNLGDHISYTFEYSIAPGKEARFIFSLYADGEIDRTAEIRVLSGKVSEQVAAHLQIAAQSADQSTQHSLADGDPIPFQAVVQINALFLDNGQLIESWNGSGTIISPDGLILTAAHVVLPNRYYPLDKLRILLTIEPDEPPVASYYAEVLQADRRLDLAVIRIQTDLENRPVERAALNLPYARLGSSAALALGDSLTILGYPGIGGKTITLSRGDVSGFTAQEGYGERAYLKTSATIAGGNSGGLAADPRGRLVAIPVQLGSGDASAVVDCRQIADTNQDGQINREDTCLPTGGFINALRPIDLALEMIAAAERGEVAIIDPEVPDIPVPEGGAILYKNDFSDSFSGFNWTTSEFGEAKVDNGEFHINIDIGSWYLFGGTHSSYGDTVIKVRTRIDTPSGDGDYGIICRMRDVNNFYALTISENGYAVIFVVEEGASRLLMDWTFAREIPQYGSALLTGACVGNRLTLGVNDQVVGDVTDYTFAGGDVGLIAGTALEPGLSIAFDDLEVRTP